MRVSESVSLLSFELFLSLSLSLSLVLCVHGGWMWRGSWKNPHEPLQETQASWLAPASSLELDFEPCSLDRRG